MKPIQINKRKIGPGYPAYVIAEMSCNHGGDYQQAVSLVHEAKKAGADAIKVQTYTPDTMTLSAPQDWFKIQSGTLWDGRTLHQLYQEAHTPWDWQPNLQKVAQEVGIDFFSSPFDDSAVDFLEKLNLPAYKVASFELVDIPLIQRIAQTGKPMILSTGLASRTEILEAVQAARQAGATQIALLKCTSEYPAQPADMNLSAIPYWQRVLGVPVGLSDHSQGIEIASAAVAMGACIVEKHLILSRSQGGPDAPFSLEPSEFQAMVQTIRKVEQAVGSPHHQISRAEEKNRCFRRSLFVVSDVKQGESFTKRNVRSIRPANGLAPKYFPVVLGKKAARDITRGTPLSWDLISGGAENQIEKTDLVYEPSNANANSSDRS